MICLGILWNSMDKYKEEIKREILRHGKILADVTLNLGDKYEQFVRDIYAQDNTAQWKVNKKIETMFENDSRKITILIMNIETKEKHYHKLKEKMVYTNLENMKIDIRSKFSKLIDNYFFDNIFHVTDDEREFELDYEILKKYFYDVEILADKCKNCLRKKKVKK